MKKTKTFCIHFKSADIEILEYIKENKGRQSVSQKIIDILDDYVTLEKSKG